MLDKYPIMAFPGSALSIRSGLRFLFIIFLILEKLFRKKEWE